MNKLKKVSIITIILYCLLISYVSAATGTINVSAARLREKPNTTSNILTNIYKDEKVEILETEGEWYKVKYGKTEGYLKKDLVKENKTDSTSNTSNKPNNSNTSSQSNNNNTSNTQNQVNNVSSKVFVSSKTSVRFSPNLMSNTVIQVEINKEFSKEKEVGNWVKVTDGNISGWILKSKLSTETVNVEPQTNETVTTDENKTTENDVKPDEEKTDSTNNSSVSNVNKKGTINVETAKVRESADSKAKVKGFLDIGDEITIIAEEGEWYKFTEKSISGYVHKTLVDVEKEEKISSRGNTEERSEHQKEEVMQEKVENVESNQTTNSAENVSNTVTSSASIKGQEVVNYAKQYLGYKYVLGGKNPDTGFDCSGFTRYVYLNFGFNLAFTAAGQNALGTEVARGDLQPGDLILFYDDAKTKIGHTGVHISNGDFVHAANPQRGVVIDNINTNSYYNERFVTARRFVD